LLLQVIAERYQANNYKNNSALFEVELPLHLYNMAKENLDKLGNNLLRSTVEILQIGLYIMAYYIDLRPAAFEIDILLSNQITESGRQHP
jgi:hypothetical protein